MTSFRDLCTLDGRVALITGGAGHIGREIADAFAELSATIVLLDRDEDALARVARDLQELRGCRTIAMPVDLSDEHSVKAVPEQIRAQTNRLDIIVHCAAFVGTTELEGWAVPFAEQSADAWRAAIEVNLTSAFVLTQACAPLLVASGHGSVINVSSIYGMVGPDLRIYEGTSMANPAAYAASKGGLLQLTRWLATVLAPSVRVNAITPGGVWRGQPQSFVDQYIARTPLRRMANEEDLKGAAVYLATDLSRYVTGQNIVIDGGWTAW